MNMIELNQDGTRQKDILLLGAVSALTVLLVARVAECPWGLALNIALVTGGCVSMLAGCVSANEPKKS